MILHDMLSYETLRLIWWLLLGLLLIGFAMSDGFDLGAAALLPFVARTDAERRVVIHTLAPIWEGNQTWFILGGGAIFAAWPPLYAASFSGFYLAIFLLLACLILRPVAFKFRSKCEDPVWRQRWDRALCFSGFGPALLFGTVMGNVIQGVPFRLSDDLHILYAGAWYGKFIGLLDPFSLLAAVVSLAMLVMLGGAWLTVKTTGAVQRRARRYGSRAGLVALLAYALAGLWLAWGIPGYQLVGEYVTGGPSNPHHFTAVPTASWFSAYGQRPWIAVAPAMGFAGILAAVIGLRLGREIWSLLCAQMAVFGIIASVGLVMFPFLLPSSIDARSSLLVWNASSSHLTLFIMLICALIFLPLILTYTAWVYRVMAGKVTEADIAEPPEPHD